MLINGKEIEIKPTADLSGANLSGANLYEADLSRANLSGANLSGANLSSANLFRADLYGANLIGADLYRANLYGVNLIGADFSRANLSRANLSGTNLSRANLSGANLSGANLSGANFYEAVLSGADLSRAFLLGVNWYGTILPKSMIGEIDEKDYPNGFVEKDGFLYGVRTKSTPWIKAGYSNGIYSAHPFCSDPTMECAPGLYVARNVQELLMMGLAGPYVIVRFRRNESVQAVDKVRTKWFQVLGEYNHPKFVHNLVIDDKYLAAPVAFT